MGSLLKFLRTNLLHTVAAIQDPSEGFIVSQMGGRLAG